MGGGGMARGRAVKRQGWRLDGRLAARDAKLGVSLRQESRAVQRDLGITTIYVTHDQEEALAMSDRIVVMNEGRVEQIGEAHPDRGDRLRRTLLFEPRAERERACGDLQHLHRRRSG